MNLFILSTDPIQAARDHCDRHIVKMPLETAQMLVGAFYIEQGITSRGDIQNYSQVVSALFHDFPRRDLNHKPFPYGISHLNHPCSLWVRECDQNFLWAIELGKELCKEYSRRYQKTHACEAIIEWCASLPVPAPASKSLTPFAQALPEELRGKDAVTAYRSYYKIYKSKIAAWNYSNKPEWW